MCAAPNASEIEVAGLEHEHITELQQLLSETLAVQTEQDRRLAQLTDELALKSALLEQAETNAAEAKRSAELERRENTDRLLVQTSLVKQKDAALGRLQAEFDELLLSRVQDVSDVDHRLAGSAMQHPTSRTADTDANADKYERSQHAFEQVAKYETELAEVRAELEAKKSELEVVRSRLMDAENGWAKSRAEAVTGSSQDQVTLWRNKYEALAKLYSQLRTEHLDMLSTCKQLQLKVNAQTAAGESVHGSWTPRMVVPRAEQRQRQDRPRIKLLYGEMSMRLLPSCTASYVRSTKIRSQRARNCNSKLARSLQQVSSIWMGDKSCLGLWNA